MLLPTRAVIILLGLLLGLSACEENVESAPSPESVNEADFDRERQDQLRKELDRYRELDRDDYTVAPIDEPITEGVLTTSLSGLYIDGFGMCTDVTFKYEGAIEKQISGRYWEVTLPNGKSYQGRIPDDDGLKMADHRGVIVLEPGRTRQVQVCLAGADERLGLPNGLYKITHEPALMNTHVWLTVL